MHPTGIRRRSFLLSGLASTGLILIAGCGEGASEAPPKPEEDPSVKAKDSMDFYKKNMNKPK